MVESTGETQWTIDTLREHLLTLVEANDLRYAQRFDASQSAMSTAFSAQQTAMQTALAAQSFNPSIGLPTIPT